jgi:hypothetical protein
MSKRPKKTQKTPKPNLPPHHPEAVARMADAMEWKITARNFPVEDYIEAVCKLQARGYSYAEIADFLNEQLAVMLGPKKITRGQVYRVYQQWLELQDPFKEGMSVTHIDDQDAEAKAEVSDKKSRKPTEENSS